MTGSPARYPVEPELVNLADATSNVSFAEPFEARALIEEVARARAAEVDVAGVDVDDTLIAVGVGVPDLAVRVYRAGADPDEAQRPSRPAVLVIHGGGFFAGTVDSVHRTSVEIARSVGAVVVAVDYRLAPEHPFPAAFEDCWTAFEWMHDRAADLGIDRRRVAVHGSSAGGALAAALALRARDTGGPSLCFQSLEAPALDDRLDTRSMHRFVDTPMWTRAAAATSWAWYLGERDVGATDVEGRASNAHVSPYAAPARASDLSGLPPAYVTVMEFDPLRDEGIAYAQALLDAGVSVELHLFGGTFHGSSVAVDAVSSRRQADERIAVLRRALAV